MPFSFIPTVLGVGFVLIWIFIGGMILRDGQFAVRRDQETDDSGSLPARRENSLRGPHWGPRRSARNGSPSRPVSAA
jgi:hypothetical protein